MKTKVCYTDTEVFNCGKTLPIESFQHRKRERFDGSFSIIISGRCKQCEYKYQKSKRELTTGNIIKKKDPAKQEAARERERQKHKPLDHCGPRGVERLFCCDLMATSGYWTA